MSEPGMKVHLKTRYYLHYDRANSEKTGKAPENNCNAIAAQTKGENPVGFPPDSNNLNCSIRLTFGELETPAGRSLAVFLSLLDT